jgi:hypothetical protein
MTSFRNILLFVLLALALIACNDDEKGPKIIKLDAYGIQITNPTDKQFVTPGDEVKFSGLLSGDTTKEMTALKASWTSDVDGVLNENSLTKNGKSEFATTELSLGIHKITFAVKNQIDSSISKSITIYNLLKLFPLTKTSSAVSLKWTAWTSPTFVQYQVVRSRDPQFQAGPETVFTSTDNAVDSFADSTAEIGVTYFYKVVAKYQGNLVATSAVQEMAAGVFIKTDFPVLKIITDPKRDLAYGIVRPESIYDENKTGYGLIFIDTKNLRIIKRIHEDVKFSDMDLSLDGDYLYLTSRSSILHKVNLLTQVLDQTYSLDHPAHKVETGSGNRIIYHELPPTSGSTPMWMFDLSTGSDIPDKRPPNIPLELGHGDFEVNTLNNEIIHGESNSSYSCLSKVSTENDSLRLVQQGGCNQYGRDLIVFNPTKNTIGWVHWLFDYNFNVLGTLNNGQYDERVTDISPDGELVLGDRNVFSTSTFHRVRTIPKNFNAGAFKDSKRLVLTYSNSMIYREWIGIIFFYDLE